VLPPAPPSGAWPPPPPVLPAPPPNPAAPPPLDPPLRPAPDPPLLVLLVVELVVAGPAPLEPPVVDAALVVETVVPDVPVVLAVVVPAVTSVPPPTCDPPSWSIPELSMMPTHALTNRTVAATRASDFIRPFFLVPLMAAARGQRPKNRMSSL